jgi:hypothetical protein
MAGGGKRIGSGRPLKVSDHQRHIVGKDCEDRAQQLRTAAEQQLFADYVGPDVHTAQRALERGAGRLDKEAIVRLRNIVDRGSAEQTITFDEYKRRHALRPKGRAAIVRAVAKMHGLREREVWAYWRSYSELSRVRRA